MKTRQLTAAEKQFVKEAEEGHFMVAYEDDGTPFALGASGTDNLFTMQVDERPEPDGGACYTLHV